MADLNKAAVAKLRKDGRSYEIFVNSESAWRLRNGENVSVYDAVVTDEIFYDAKKGERASERELKNLFGTDDKAEICKIIIRDGHVPMTAHMIRGELENKRKQIVNIIHRNAVNPKTGKPHPPARIESAISESGFKVDANKSAEEQINAAVESIRSILPIKFEVRELGVKILAQYSGRVFPVLKKYGKLLKEEWLNDGSLFVNLEMPAGLQEELEVDLNKIAKGTIEINVVRVR